MTDLRTDAPVDADDQDAADLTGEDHLVVETVKEVPDAQDDDLPCPDQDPNVIPRSTIDENGRQL